MGQLSGSSQPQTGNIEEFPPLGRNGNEESEQDRRGSLMHNAAFGGFSNADAFTLPQSSAQTRQGLPNAPNNQGNNNRPSVLVDRILSPSALGFGGKSCNAQRPKQANKLRSATSSNRSPAESARQGPTANLEFDKAVNAFASSCSG